MNVLSYKNTSKAQKDARQQSPVKVCIFLLKEALTDVRTMRGASTLTEAGFAVSIVDVISNRSSEEEEVHAIRLNHIVNPKWYVSARFKPWFLVKATNMIIRSILQLLQTPADIYHAHDELALFPCYLAARLRRKPLIFEPHEIPLCNDPKFTRWPRLHALATRLLKHMVPYCTALIVVSPPIVQMMHDSYHASRVVLLRNVPEYHSVAKSDRLRQHLGLPSEVRIALYQGNFQTNRGLDTLIEAAKFLERNIVIVLMGKDFEGNQSRFETLIAHKNLTDRIKILPPVPYTELLDWTASADIGLTIFQPEYSMNVRLCLPNKFSEYLMAGLPVLSTQLDVLAELITTYDVGRVVDSLEPEDIGKAINAMLADQEALTRMSRNALQASREEFNWDKEKQHLLALYHDVLTSLSRPDTLEPNKHYHSSKNRKDSLL